MQRCVVIFCDQGKIGTLRQCEALAGPMAQGLDANVFSIPIQLPLWKRCLLPHITRWLPLSWLLSLKDLPPIEQIPCVIAAGRQAILIAARIARNIPTLVVLNPRCPLHYFHKVIAPRHDNLTTTQNLIEIIGSLHPYAFKISTTQSDAPKSLAVLLGGVSRHHIYTALDIDNLCTYIKNLCHSFECTHKEKLHLYFLGSRRTPQWILTQILDTFKDYAHLTLWPQPSLNETEQSDNPYHAVLQQSSVTIITSDSVSMISEACYFAKPTIIWDLGIKNKRFLSFYDSILKGQHAIMVGGHAAAHDTAQFSIWNTLEQLSFVPLREADRVNALLKKTFTPTLML